MVWAVDKADDSFYKRMNPLPQVIFELSKPPESETP